ncbi:MAG: prolyl oligopeptidase family serine peptidase, partial [Deltaproteobacteria bacterium]|nr:prolyl oligopeptidase family serine peptidase [Deltaproteobacteria bacterium]
SPLTYLENAKTPVQLAHWEGDLRCPIGQSEEVFSALKLRGVEVEMLRYPGGSHVGRTPSQDIDSTRRTLDWYAAHAPAATRKSGS